MSSEGQLGDPVEAAEPVREPEWVEGAVPVPAASRGEIAEPEGMAEPGLPGQAAEAPEHEGGFIRGVTEPMRDHLVGPVVEHIVDPVREHVVEPMMEHVAGFVGPVTGAVGPVAAAVGHVLGAAGDAIAGHDAMVALRLRRRAREPLASLYELYPEARDATPREIGIRFVPLEEILGTAVAGGAQRGGDFLPLPAFRSDNWVSRWQRIQRANERLVPLPPVNLYKFADGFWVDDGHNRVAAALYAGGAGVDAVVTELVPLGARATERAGGLEGLLSDARSLQAQVFEAATARDGATDGPQLAVQHEHDRERDHDHEREAASQPEPRTAHAAGSEVDAEPG